MEKLKRNRAATTQRIVDALEEVLATYGIEGLSVTLLAEKAAISKVLIYRYFGGLDGLLEYYVRMGQLIPQYSPGWLEQIRPHHPRELGHFWSGQVLQVFRRFRASKAARELLKATIKENDPLAPKVSEALDGEFSRLMDELAFREGSDSQATSAILLGALSYLTIQAQNGRPMIGLDLRSESDWLRIEAAVKLIYQAIAQSSVDLPMNQADRMPASVALSTW